MIEICPSARAPLCRTVSNKLANMSTFCRGSHTLEISFFQIHLILVFSEHSSPCTDHDAHWVQPLKPAAHSPTPPLVRPGRATHVVWVRVMVDAVFPVGRRRVYQNYPPQVPPPPFAAPPHLLCAAPPHVPGAPLYHRATPNDSGDCACQLIHGAADATRYWASPISGARGGPSRREHNRRCRCTAGYSLLTTNERAISYPSPQRPLIQGIFYTTARQFTV